MSLKHLVPTRIRRLMRRKLPWLQNPPPVGAARFHRLRRTTPIRRNFGWDSGGQCVDRYYIEKFLDAHRSDIRGRVMEIGDNSYTRQFGGEAVTESHVLHAKAGNPEATLVGDLESGEGIPTNAFDCIILTQTLLCIYDVRRAIANAHRALASGGVLLVTVPGIAQIARYDMEQWGDFWRFTSLSASRLFTESFGDEGVTVETHGNVFSALAFLHGLVSSELTQDELDDFDRDYEVIITVRASK